jgi:hypothetical protein
MRITASMLDSVCFRYGLLLLVGLVIADGIITQFIINSGLGWESNPFMRIFLSNGHFMLVKVGGSVLVALLLADMYRHHAKTARVAAWLFVLVYTGIVYWNIGGFLLSI